MTAQHSLANDTRMHALPRKYLHDLRTQIGHILGFAEILKEQANEDGQLVSLPDIEGIETAARLLLAMVTDGVPTVPSDVHTNVQTTIPTPEPLPMTTPDAETPLPALILVVDDNEVNRDVLSRRLQRQGHSVVLAENGLEAMKAVRSRPFDLVLLDIMMPELDGYAVLQQIKADPALSHLPVIMISAVDDIESVSRCIVMGADDYLSKPFDATLLKARTGACLVKKRAHDREVELFCKLQESYKRLQLLEASRDDLTNMIVHDLRTPLTSVITGVQSLENTDGLDDFQCEMIGIALSGGETLLGMINDLLDVEKMESGTMELEYGMVNAAGVVASAASQVASLCKSKRLTLTTLIADDLPAFLADESKLRRVLVNLLGNAIKFTQEGGTMTVDVRLAASVEGLDGMQSLVFSVSDTGEGIPAEALERIFEKFGQVESRRGGRVASTGLGLTFCRLAVNAHGGQIGVESTPGEGSMFSFTVPIPPAI